MHWVQAWLFGTVSPNSGFPSAIRNMFNGTVSTVGKDSKLVVDALSAASMSQKTGRAMIWDIDPDHARMKLDPGKLRDQMFAFTVTGQVTNTLEVMALPFILRKISAFRKSRAAAYSQPKIITSKTSEAGLASGNSSAVKSISRSNNDTGWLKEPVAVIEDEKESEDLAEHAFLDKVREEAALPEYDLFVDYSEMVVQFGYVVLWSTIWPLAASACISGHALQFSFFSSTTDYLPFQLWRSSTIFLKCVRTHLRSRSTTGVQYLAGQIRLGHGWILLPFSPGSARLQILRSCIYSPPRCSLFPIFIPQRLLLLLRISRNS